MLNGSLRLHRVFPDQTFYAASKLIEQLTMLGMPFFKTFIKLSCNTCILNNFLTCKDFKIGCKFRLVCKQSLFHNALFKPNCFVPSVVLWDLFIRVEKAKICKLNFAEQDSNQSLNSVGALRKVYLATHTPRSLGPVSLI